MLLDILPLAGGAARLVRVYGGEPCAVLPGAVPGPEGQKSAKFLYFIRYMKPCENISDPTQGFPLCYKIFIFSSMLDRSYHSTFLLLPIVKTYFTNKYSAVLPEKAV